MRVLMLGSAGLLGCTLSPILSSRGYEVKGHSRRAAASCHADLTSTTDTYRLLDEVGPDSILNLVALTDVDRCEANPNEAYLLNVRTVENIVSWIKERNSACHLVHISTDHIYDHATPHTEDDISLVNYYGFSKYAGELAAANVPSTILRTNFVGRSHCATRTSFTDWLFRALSNRESIQAFDDVFFSPLAMTTLSEMIALSLCNRPVGVFNLGSHLGMSKADFAFAFANTLGLPTGSMRRTTSDQAAQLKAYRPKDMRMDSTKFENALGVKLPDLKDEIERASEEYREHA